MLDDYLKRLESLITPETYSKANFRERIGVLSKTSEMISSNKDLVFEDNKRLIDSYLNKMGVKEQDQKSLSESRVKIYNKILESEGKLQNPPEENFNRTGRLLSPDRSTTSLDNTAKRLTFSPDSHDPQQLREKVHSLNLKNMNYRHEIENYKQSVSSLNKELDEYKQLIQKFERQKDSDNKYLLKLENMLQNSRSNSLLSMKTVSNPNGAISDLSRITSGKNKKNTSFNDLFSVEFSKNNILIEEKGNNNILNVNDKEELRMLVLNLLTENKKLKDFQTQVFEISKHYDSINESILEAVRNIQGVLNKEPDLNERMELINNFDKILLTVENTLELKNKEYNFLIETKDKEIALYSNELVNSNSDLENMKKDRLRDQKIINDLENEIEFLNSRIAELQQMLEGDKNHIINGIFEQNKIVEKIEVNKKFI
jgi:hypothetical protein